MRSGDVIVASVDGGGGGRRIGQQNTGHCHGRQREMQGNISIKDAFHSNLVCLFLNSIPNPFLRFLFLHLRNLLILDCPVKSSKLDSSRVLYGFLKPFLLYKFHPHFVNAAHTQLHGLSLHASQTLWLFFKHPNCLM